MRVIFLDIDGVLITRETLAQMSPSPDCVNALNRITDATDAQIVVSSSWRRICNIREILRGWGVRATVCSTTPDLDNRGNEIRQWLSERPQVDDFIVIDDEVFDLGNLVTRTIQTSMEFGLTRELAEVAIRMIGE